MSFSSTPLNRREFITRSTLITATMSSLAANLSAAPESAKKPQAVGERIDCQSHLFCPAAIELMEKRKTDPSVYTVDGVRILRMGDWYRKIPAHYTDVDAKLALLGRQGAGGRRERQHEEQQP